MSKAPWYKRYAADFVSDPYVQAMTAEQYGWFSAMLDMAWIHTPQGYMPNAIDLLCRMVGRCDEMHFAKHSKIVLDRFKVTPDGLFLYHPKMIEQVEKLSQVSEKRSEVGKKGADKRWNSNCHKPTKQLPTDSDSESELVSISRFTLPIWIPEKAFKDFVEMRRVKRQPLTQRAKELAVKKLETLMNAGNDPEAVLNRSVENGWTGLFPLEEKHGTNRQNQPIRVSAATARNERNAQAFANVARKIGLDTPMAATGEPPIQRGVDGGGHRVLAADPIILPPKGNRDVV
jgi:uncharacterized protein YdaU (DUF1376 family)